MVIGNEVGALVFAVPSYSSAILSERISGMTPTQLNDRLGSEYWSFGDISEEKFPTHGTRMLSENARKSFRRVLEPWGSFLQLASCVIAVSLDPLFLYVPVINDPEKCFHFDNKLRIAALVLRSVTDFIFMLHIASQFRTGYVAKPILFLIDILSLLPIPQVVILYVIPEMKGSKSLTARNILTALVLLQYVPRVVRIYPIYKKLTWTPSIFKETTWTKAALNLFIYVLASHVLGALWYFFSIEREITCWQEACKGHPGCDHGSFFCDDGIRATEFLRDMCPVDTENKELFDFGIFLDALQSGIVESVNLPQKFFRCHLWGLQNLSSLGQNLRTSIYTWENIFVVAISTYGLVLFSNFIENIQTYMQQSKAGKEEEKITEIRSKADAFDLWMSNNNLPECIRRRIKHSVERKWHEIRSVDSENLISILPMDLQIDIKRHICSVLVKRVPVLALMDDQLLDAMCGRLKLMVYSKDSYVIRKGDPVKEMCFIFHGEVLSGLGRTEFRPVKLQTGDFCGEELLTWVFKGRSLTNLPISNQSALALVSI